MNDKMMELMVAKQRDRKRVLDALYQRLVVGEEVRQMKAELFASALGMPAPRIGERIKEIAHLGILNRRLEMGSYGNGMSMGRHFHWTLMVPKDEAVARLIQLDADEQAQARENYAQGFEKQRETRRKANGAEHTEAKPVERLGITVREGEPVEAIVGPEPPAPLADLRQYRKNESFALVEAARQYAERHTKVGSSIEDLIAQAKAYGVTIDIDTVRQAVQFERDERLEDVGLVLPYVDELERAVSRLTNERTELYKKIADLNAAKVENTKLKAQVDRMIAQKVTAAQA